MDETIMNVPLAQLRPRLSTRIWNLLTRNGFTTEAQVQHALDDGLRPGDIKNLGAAALLEIRLALADLPPQPREPAPGAPAGLSSRELEVILGLAEAGMSEQAWSWHGGYPGYPAENQDEALAALRHLHLVVRGTPRPDGIPDPEDSPSQRDRPSGGPPASWRAEWDSAEDATYDRSAAASEQGWTVPQPVDSYQPGRTGPEPLDDEYEGYVLDTPPGWGTTR